MSRNLVCRSLAGNLCLALLILGWLGTSASAQFTSYADRTQFLLTPPGIDAGGFAGFVNPAALSLLPAPESSIIFSSGADNRTIHADGGWFGAVPHLGIGVLHQQRPGLSDLSEIRLGLGLGNEEFAFGIGRGWSRGAPQEPNPVWVAGLIARPGPRWSLASTWTQGDGDQRELAGDIGYRPWKTDQLTLFAEGVRSSAAAGAERFWSLGVDARVAEGLYVSSRFLDGRSISLGIRAQFGPGGIESQARDRGKRAGTRRSFALRLGPHRGDALTRYRKPAYLDLPLTRPVRHRTFRVLDESDSHLQLLLDLEHVKEDPRVMGVAIDLTGLQIDPALSWELRQQLLDLRAEGHFVVVYIHRADLRRYHLASAADRVVLDPYGLVGLEGLVAGRVYLADALEKIGIGTQEWRTGEFKSAFETFRRQDLSEADREQLLALLDDAYADMRHDITHARNMSSETFDYLVDGPGILTADEALQEGLVDTLGRWSAVEEILEAEGAHGGIDRWRLARPVDTTWGRRPTIAIAYALGVCDLDTGIRARTLTRELRQLATDDGVDAVVLRVDSPGGDALASDWVAEAIAEISEHKPVVVSHGRVAASGGYWISMEADAIVTSPHTITGSIGVIGGWMYDDGLKERLGVATDHVQVGDHADLGFGLPLPFVGTTLPDRPLRSDEAARVDATITSMYEQFVGRVAKTRGQTITYVDSIARGRVWSGPAAVKNGLADTIGTLMTAIDVARERAAIGADEEVQILEVPTQRWFSSRSAGLFGLMARFGQNDTPAGRLGALQSWIDFHTRYNGRAMPMLPANFIEDHQAPTWSGGKTDD
ncbi:MAG: hypothetical protein HN712_25260 [Gemmatimonadetes bacterium]|nr:hypothetical protein [Gemmatimonadota bacterium]MBT6147386.1 hypothetical protein [Gemmatimonadota bacterium]MBT7863650.1 hypothetical protein [Gemmatimonadota bacterium]